MNGISYTASFNKGKGREELLNFLLNPLAIPLDPNGHFVESVETNVCFKHSTSHLSIFYLFPRYSYGTKVPKNPPVIFVASPCFVSFGSMNVNLGSAKGRLVWEACKPCSSWPMCSAEIFSDISITSFLYVHLRSRLDECLPFM